MHRFKKILLIYFKGVGMGGADVVPGVSGGTIALITGIYERLLLAIRSVDVEALKLLFSLKFEALWRKVDGNFLLPLILGIITSFLSLAKLMTYLLANHPIALWSFFFGLIIISAILVLKVVQRWRIATVIAVIAGIVIAWLITEATPSETPEANWFIFISGAIAVCAMILPGISGSFILLILGKYEYMMAALSGFDVLTIAIFVLGCVTGLLTFARVISWFLKHYHDITIALLSGFMIGSLNKVWPWKVPVSFRVDSHGEQVPFVTKNVLPAEYYRQMQDNPEVFIALLFMALGVLIVVMIEKVANYNSKTSK